MTFEPVPFAAGRVWSLGGTEFPRLRDLLLGSLSGLEALAGLAPRLGRLEGQAAVVGLAQMLGAHGVSPGLVEELLLECGACVGCARGAVGGIGPGLVGADLGIEAKLGLRNGSAGLLGGYAHSACS